MANKDLEEIALDLAYERARNRNLSQTQKQHASTLDALSTVPGDLAQVAQQQHQLDQQQNQLGKQLDVYAQHQDSLANANNQLVESQQRLLSEQTRIEQDLLGKQAHLEEQASKNFTDLKQLVAEQADLILRLDDALRDNEKQLREYEDQLRRVTAENKTLSSAVEVASNQQTRLAAELTSAQQSNKQIISQHNELITQLRSIESRSAGANTQSSATLSAQGVRLEQLEGQLDSVRNELSAASSLLSMSLDNTQTTASSSLLSFAQSELQLKVTEPQLDQLSQRMESIESRCLGELDFPHNDCLAAALSLLTIPSKQLRLLQIGSTYGLLSSFVWDCIRHYFQSTSLCLVDPFDAKQHSEANSLALAPSKPLLEQNFAQVGLDIRKTTLLTTNKEQKNPLAIAGRRKFNFVVVSQSALAAAELEKKLGQLAKTDCVVWCSNSYSHELASSAAWQLLYSGSASALFRKCGA